MRPAGWVGAALAAVFVGCALPSTAHAEDLMYYVDDGRVVFTNVPSRPDAKPVPWNQQVLRLSSTVLPVTPYDSFIRRVANEHGVDPALVKAVALVESNMDPEAVSPKGARGLMQLMPATARRYGVDDPHDPYQSLRAGAAHLRDLLDEFGNDELALAAYNAGSGAVRRHGGIPAYKETRNYVRKVHRTLGTVPGNGKPGSTPVAEAGEVTMTRKADGTILLEN